MLSLAKGGKLNLSKDLGLKEVTIEVSWTEKKFDTQADFDVDVTAFVLEEDGSPFGRVLRIPTANDGWVCFYNQLELSEPGKPAAIKHHGDLRTGGMERITCTFPNMPAQASRVAIIVTIHDAEARRQNFGQIDEAWVRLKNGDKVEAEFDLDENAANATSLMFTELKKNDKGEWVAQNVNEGFQRGLEDFFKAYKVPGFA